MNALIKWIIVWVKAIDSTPPITFYMISNGKKMIYRDLSICCCFMSENFEAVWDKSSLDSTHVPAPKFWLDKVKNRTTLFGWICIVHFQICGKLQKHLIFTISESTNIFYLFVLPKAEFSDDLLSNSPHLLTLVVYNLQDKLGLYTFLKNCSL